MFLADFVFLFLLWIRKGGPTARYDHSAAVYADQYLLIFGGSSHSTCYNDLYLLDLQTVSYKRRASSWILLCKFINVLNYTDLQPQTLFSISGWYFTSNSMFSVVAGLPCWNFLPANSSCNVELSLPNDRIKLQSTMANINYHIS
jgi:hypothetical protein